MSDELRRVYEEFPYDDIPVPHTHPDCLATAAHLAGLEAPPVLCCRVLELGCASGANLIPLAELLPESHFVGIDLAPGQIDAAQSMAAELGLSNVRFEARSILDIGPEAGTFDYVLCHGVFSWVPFEVQEKIFAIIATQMARNGVAYISYNTYPGWHQKQALREMMLYHVAGTTGERERAARARELLDLLMETTPQKGSTWARILQDQVPLLGPGQDAYLAHEYLEPFNQPLYFHQFATRAAASHLQYLADGETDTASVELPESAHARLSELGADPIRLGQYLDFIHGRMFRRSLLCHEGWKLDRVPSPDAALLLQIRPLARPASPTPDVAPGVSEEFQGRRGGVVTTDSPLVKSMLLALHAGAPKLMSFETLLSSVKKQVGEAGATSAALAEAVLECRQFGLLSLHRHAPEWTSVVSERPIARPSARHQATRKLAAANAFHELVNLDGFDLLLLPLLDGTRDRAALQAWLERELRARKMMPLRDGKPVEDEAEQRRLVAMSLEESLRGLAASALLCG